MWQRPDIITRTLFARVVMPCDIEISIPLNSRTLMTDSLYKKTALITGASAGIGRALALTLAASGVSVVVSARRSGRLNDLVSEIRSKSGSALPVTADASDVSDIDRLFQTALEWDQGGKKIDIVVVNAGRGLAGSLLQSDESQWTRLYQVNVLGAAHLMRIAGKYMQKRRTGHIIVIGSTVGRNISPFSSFYGSSKFAVGALAEGLRRELAPDGVRVSLVMPGIVLSEFQDVAGYNEENFGKTVAQFGKLLEPSDIAEGIRWMLALPPHVNVNEIMIRPTGQPYP
jgi:NADP-dependent 3-hydroxy acid dehydrogenase YdfG